MSTLLVAALQTLSILSLAFTVSASPTFASSARVKRSVEELHESYDYVVVGGGTSGLTVANRLSEDPSKNVLVVEYGYFGDEPCIWMPVSAVSRITGPPCDRHRFMEQTVPQPGLNNATTIYMGGAVVGGSSAINGMVFDRGTKTDYDAWEALGNPGWGWDGMFPYFKKSASFTPPSQEVVEKYGLTWDPAAYGGGPIQATFSSFQWETNAYLFAAWKDLNITGPKEHALGDAVGRFWFPASQHPVNQTRSYARYGHYDPISQRNNYHLLIGHKAERILLSSDNTVQGVRIHDRNSPNQTFIVKATKETVIATGGVHTTQLLELSGIGSKAILEAAGIEQKVDLPGVGENFQDHPQVRFRCNFTNDFWPNPDTLATNTTFQAEALVEYNANKTGPLTLSSGPGVVFLPLNTTHSSPASFLAKFSAQAPDAYLRPNLPASVIAGYVAQKEILADLFPRSDFAPYESPLNGACSRLTILQKPLSRGSIHINSTFPSGPPLIDFRVFSNPLDVEYAMEVIKYNRKYMNTPTLAPLRPVEIGPGANISDTELEAWVHATSGPTSFHVSGTAAMMPRELGGVVSSDLRVYGTKGLSVVDASIMPLIPAAHLSATVYAVAEKAADIIKKRYI